MFDLRCHRSKIRLRKIPSLSSPPGHMQKLKSSLCGGKQKSENTIKLLIFQNRFDLNYSCFQQIALYCQQADLWPPFLWTLQEDSRFQKNEEEDQALNLCFTQIGCFWVRSKNVRGKVTYWASLLRFDRENYLLLLVQRFKSFAWPTEPKKASISYIKDLKLNVKE